MGIIVTRLNDSSNNLKMEDFFRAPNTKYQVHLNGHDECLEIRWPTCSYRMGEFFNFGYGFATIGFKLIIFNFSRIIKQFTNLGKDGMMEFGVLWSMPRFLNIFIHVPISWLFIFTLWFGYFSFKTVTLGLICTILSYIIFIVVSSI